MEKSRFPPKPGEGAGKGVSINFRPQACSLPRRRLGSRVGEIPEGDPLRTSSGQPRDPAQCLTPRCYTSRPPPLFGKPRGGVCLLLARTAGLANPWEEVPYDIHPEGQSALTVLLRRQSSRGGSGAVAWPGEGGRSCQRSRLQPPPLLGTRARPDPSSLGRLRGARAVGVPGPRTPGPRLGRPRIASLPGVRVGRDPAAASRGRHWSGGARRRAPGSKNSPGRSPRFCSQAAVRFRVRARAPCRGPLDPARRVPGQFPSLRLRVPLSPRVPSVYSHAFFQAWPSNP